MSRRFVGIAVAFLVGIAAAEFWLHLILPEERVRWESSRIEARRSPEATGLAQRTRPESEIPERRSSHKATVSKEKLSGNRNPQPAYRPREAALGAAGTPWLHRSKYAVLNLARLGYRRDDPALQAAERDRELATVRKTDALFESAMKATRDERIRLGSPPWTRQRFQILATAKPGFSHPVTVVGRDFRVEASPEQSLAWYARAGTDAETRAAMLATLREYERIRRDLLARVVAQAFAAAESAPNPDVFAFVVLDGKVVTLTEDEIEGLGAVLDRAVDADVAFREAFARER